LLAPRPIIMATPTALANAIVVVMGIETHMM
jgi:hypothetical protein